MPRSQADPGTRSAVNLTFLPSISPPPYEEYAKVIIEEGVKVVETAGGPQAAPIIKMFKDAGGIYVIHKVRSFVYRGGGRADARMQCTSIRHAKSAAKLNVDMLSIDGFECAGHPGEDGIGGLVLVRAVCPGTKGELTKRTKQLALAAKKLNIPYLASGGIGDGRGLAAAIALGASGVSK